MFGLERPEISGLFLQLGLHLLLFVPLSRLIRLFGLLDLFLELGKLLFDFVSLSRKAANGFIALALLLPESLD